jgi:hypothetical protein
MYNFHIGGCNELGKVPRGIVYFNKISLKILAVLFAPTKYCENLKNDFCIWESNLPTTLRETERPKLLLPSNGSKIINGV